MQEDSSASPRRITDIRGGAVRPVQKFWQFWRQEWGVQEFLARKHCHKDWTEPSLSLICVRSESEQGKKRGWGVKGLVGN